MAASATGSIDDGDRKGHRVGLTGNLDVLDPVAVGTTDEWSALGGFLDLAVVGCRRDVSRCTPRENITG